MLGFTFDTLDSQHFDVLAGNDPPQALAESMHGAWVRFVNGKTRGNLTDRTTAM